VPTVARISTTPVKSLLLNHPDEILLESFGVATDRRFYLIREDGRLLAGLHHGPLALIRADWDPGADRLRLTFPDGNVVEDEVGLAEPLLTDFWGHRVSGRLVKGPWADALSAFAGRPVRLVKADEPAGGVDAEPLTLVSSESIAELGRQAGFEAVDGRRFRMLLEVEGCAPHEEDTGSRDREARLRHAAPDRGVPRQARREEDRLRRLRDSRRAGASPRRRPGRARPRSQVAV
jgi:uncharacterized protein